jgi:hypothetical protein
MDVDVVLGGRESDSGIVNIASEVVENGGKAGTRSESGTVNLASSVFEVLATARERGMVKRKSEVGVGEAGVSRYGGVGDGGRGRDGMW